MNNRQDQLNRSLDGLKLMLSEHVVYEIHMMRGAYSSLSVPVGGWFSQVAVNAMMESFCIHARNLIKFFNSTASPSEEEAAARHFALETYVPFPNGGPSKELKAKLNKQVAHLSYGRTKRDDDKIGPEDRALLMQFIEAEVLNFTTHLRPAYSDVWPFPRRG